MSYAASIKSFPNLVNNMFGLVSRNRVMRAIQLAREDARLDRIANHDADMAEFAALVKRLAKKASRPVSARGKGVEPDPLVPRS